MMRKTVLFGMRSQIFALMCSLLLFSPALPADSVWEGSAAVSRYNEFPDTGFYGASNSFPRNTTVNVENLENGRKVRLIITGRVSDPALFILVSKEAASALGIPSGEIVRTRVVIAKETAAENYVRPDDSQVNPDPDINPAMIAKNILPKEEPKKTEEKKPVEEKPVERKEETPLVVEKPSVQVVVPPTNTEAAKGGVKHEAAVPEAPIQEEPKAVKAVENEEPKKVEPKAEVKDEPRLAQVKDAEARKAGDIPNPKDVALLPSEEKPVYESLNTSVQEDKSLQKQAMLPEPPRAVKDVPEVASLHAVPETQKKMLVNIFIPEEPRKEVEAFTYDGVKSASPESRRLVLTERVELPLEPQVDRPAFSLLAARYANRNARVFSGPYDLPGEPLVYSDAPVMVAMEAQAARDSFSLSLEGVEIPFVPAAEEKKSPAEASADLAKTDSLLSGSGGEKMRTLGSLALQAPEEPERESGLPSYALFDTAYPEGEASKLAALALPEILDKPYAYPEVLAQGPLAGEKSSVDISASDLPEEPKVLEGPTVTALLDADADGKVLTPPTSIDYPEPQEGRSEGPTVTALLDADADGKELTPPQSLASPKLEEKAPEVKPEVPTDTKIEHKKPQETKALVETTLPEVDIMLIPADKRPPVLTEKTASEPELKQEEKKPEVKLVEKKPEEKPKTEEKPEVSVVEETPAGKTAKAEVKEAVKESGAALALTPALLKGSYYLQLGAFLEEPKARNLAARFTATYPMTIHVAETGAKKTYKVLIGPLKQDESGVLLFTIKSSGYKDAFLVKN